MMIMVLAIMFMGSIQPLMMVVSLILITLFYSFCIMKVMGSFWFSYALVMIMLSGMFVIFIYMASLIPNEEFEIYSTIFFVILMFMLFVNDIENLMHNFEFVSLNLWMNYMGICMMFLSIFLLVIMLMVVWLSMSKGGALRVV